MKSLALKLGAEAALWRLCAFKPTSVVLAGSLFDHTVARCGREPVNHKQDEDKDESD